MTAVEGTAVVCHAEADRLCMTLKRHYIFKIDG